MTVVPIVAGAVVGTGTALALIVWLVGRSEARHEAREREAMRQAGPPILGGGPRHLRRRQPPT